MDIYEPVNRNYFTNEQPSMQYAGFWPRVGASLIDTMIIGLPLSIIRLIFLHNILHHVFQYWVLSSIINWLYRAGTESGPAMATLGKRALGIKVIDMRGNRITFGQATGRYFAKWLSAIILSIGYLMMLWDDRSQTLHDKLANTLVIEE